MAQRLLERFGLRQTKSNPNRDVHAQLASAGNGSGPISNMIGAHSSNAFPKQRKSVMTIGRGLGHVAHFVTALTIPDPRSPPRPITQPFPAVPQQDTVQMGRTTTPPLQDSGSVLSSASAPEYGTTDPSSTTPPAATETHPAAASHQIPVKKTIVHGLKNGLEVAT